LSTPAPAASRTLLLGGLVLAASAAGGFALYRLMPGRTHPTLYALAPVHNAVPAADAVPPAHRPIPEELPDLTLPDLAGTPQRLRGWKGRPLIVNFWATWCEPCRREIPLLKRLRRERAGQKLEVLGIALDEGDAVRQYAARTGMDYPVLVGEKGGLEAVDAFGMDTVLPFSVFIDAAGRVVTLKIGELHPDEVGFILDRVADVDAGRLPLRAAQQQIAATVERLNVAREAQKD
jgi:thiol-disulfide isomerase/thioredoxin